MKKIITLIIFILTIVVNNNITIAYECLETDSTCNVNEYSIKENEKILLDNALENFYIKITNKLIEKEKIIYTYNLLISKLSDLKDKTNSDKIKKYIIYMNENIYNEIKKIENNQENKEKWQLWEKNTFNDSFSKAKKLLENEIYNNISWINRVSLYCGCDYNIDKTINFEACWYKNDWRYEKRALKIEWEHVVPAENFWKSFIEWREWDEECMDIKWNYFKWRSCAEKVNLEYRYMQSDMYNLIPSIWALNALRSNYQIAEIEWEERLFWQCDFEINNRKVEPPTNMKWDIARIFLYMDITYPWHDIISDKNEKLIEAWNKLDPISTEECNRYKKIKNVQWNENIILKESCN